MASKEKGTKIVSEFVALLSKKQSSLIELHVKSILNAIDTLMLDILKNNSTILDLTFDELRKLLDTS